MSSRSSNRHLWWALSPAYTVGVVAFIPALHAAIKLRRRQLWWSSAALVAGDLAAWPLLDQPDGSAVSDVGAVLAICLAVAGTVQALRLRSEVFADAAVVASGPTGAQGDPAVQQALAARQRRGESAALAARDPALARDLKIGRPDLARQYDDGGLVDVNGAPASVLVSHLRLTPAQAESVVAARDRLGRFQSVDDLTTFADVSQQALDLVRERVIAL